MDKRIEDYLHLYLGCEVIATDGGTETYILSGVEDGKPLFKTKQRGFAIQLFQWQLALRPLSDMTAEEAVKLCSIYSPEAFGDYRFSKWVAVRDEANFCYNVTNEKSDMSFHVDIEEMHIKVYEDGNDAYPGLENHTYFTEYLRMGFDIFSLIPAGLAIDKTKMNTNG